MDMRTVKENIQLESPTALAQSQALVEGEITLPGGLREEARVLHAGGMVVVDGVEAMQDRAQVAGKVVFHALYTQGDHSKVCAMEATADFTHLMDIPGARPRDLCQVDARLDQVAAAAAGGRLTLRGRVGLHGRSVNAQPVEAVTGVAGDEGIQVKARALEVKRTVASGEGETLLREEFALPEGMQIRETLCATAAARVSDVTGGLGKAGVTGQVDLEAVHASDMPGKPVVITRHTIPFEQTIDLTGEDGELLQAAVSVKDVAVASQESAEGERTLRAEVLLGSRAWADRKEAVTLLDDAYTVSGDDLRLSAREVSCRVEDQLCQAAESGKAMLMLPEGAPPVRGVLCAFASPAMTGREQVGGRLTVSGMMDVTLLYMTEESGEPVSVRMQEPFRVTFAAQAGEDDLLTLCCGDVDLTAITSDRVEMKYIMHLGVTGVTCEKARLVTEVLPVAADAPEGSIVLYFVQPGETLWDIARRYRVPVEEVRSLNPEVGEELKPGQGIVVWHRT